MKWRMEYTSGFKFPVKHSPPYNKIIYSLGFNREVISNKCDHYDRISKHCFMPDCSTLFSEFENMDNKMILV